MNEELQLESGSLKMVDVAGPLTLNDESSIGSVVSGGGVCRAVPCDRSLTTASSFDTKNFLSQMDEDEDYPKTLQEELNEILEAWYELLTEDDIHTYQKYLEDISGKKIAEGALQEVGAVAPDFELPDQDGEVVHLDELCQKGPVVLLFYRGKWCPHCNATVMRMQKIYPQIEASGAQLVCISPMLPDGTQYMATKLHLGFPVVSDVGNKTGKAFNIVFEIHPDVRESMVKWGEDLPKFNGDFTWEVPLAATYILNKGDRKIVWSFIDNDPGVRAEPDDILANIPRTNPDGNMQDDSNSCNSTCSSHCKKEKHNRGSGYASSFKLKNIRRSLKKSMEGSKNKLFGKKKDQTAQEYLMTKMV
jgi:peroxiredoxin